MKIDNVKAYRDIVNAMNTAKMKGIKEGYISYTSRLSKD